MPSITPSSRQKRAVGLNAAAALRRWSESFQRIAAPPSGEITEYTEFSIISTRSATAIASAPPEPPSPITTATDGTESRPMASIERAIAPACPRSSDVRPGWAPCVSMNVSTGNPRRLARSKTRIALP